MSQYYQLFITVHDIYVKSTLLNFKSIEMSTFLNVLKYLSSDLLSDINNHGNRQNRE